MLKKYKKSYLVINMILLVLMVFLVTNLFYYKQTSYLFCIISLLIPLTIIILVYGYEHKKRRYMYELIFHIFTYSILFLLITYLTGIFIGFTTSIYKLNLSNLIQNVLPYLGLIIIEELFRYEIVRKGDGSLASYILITLILIIIDMTLFLTTFDLSNGDAQIKYICYIILPSIFKNIILLYFSKSGGPIPPFIYRILFDLKLVIFPIFPDFGIYFDSVINCVVPVLFFGIFQFNIRNDDKQKEEGITRRKYFLFKYLFFIVLAVLVLAVNLLSSGVFKYSLIAIGSGSMSPKIEKGDAVLYRKIDKNSLPEVGEILAFKKDGKTVVHRIIEIVDTGNELIYYTKGDANESPDGYPILYKDMKGVVLLRIKYIGIPSVFLGEAISK